MSQRGVECAGRLHDPNDLVVIDQISHHAPEITL
jgi:hypothetical protein